MGPCELATLSHRTVLNLSSPLIMRMWPTKTRVLQRLSPRVEKQRLHLSWRPRFGGAVDVTRSSRSIPDSRWCCQFVRCVSTRPSSSWGTCRGCLEYRLLTHRKNLTVFLRPALSSETKISGYRWFIRQPFRQLDPISR
jgi:hypothetical protein